MFSKQALLAVIAASMLSFSSVDAVYRQLKSNKKGAKSCGKDGKNRGKDGKNKKNNKEDCTAPTASPGAPQGTPAPNSRVLERNLFGGAETKDVTEARAALEYDDDFKTLKKLNFEARMQNGYNFLSEFMYNGEPRPLANQTEASRVIVAYSAPTSMNMSQGLNEMYHTNFQYFLDNAVDCSKHSTLIVTTDEVAEAYRARIEKMNEDLCGESQHFVAVTVRANKCYDMESMATFLRQTDPTKYDYFLYVNCGMIGPKMAGDEHWTETFTSRLSDKVKLVGVSINMSFHPHVQSMVLATDQVGLDLIKNSGAIYDCGFMNNEEMTNEQRWKLIMRYEVGMSRVIVEAGYTITSLTGSLGNPIFINQGDIEEIKNKSLANMRPSQQVEEIDYSIWNSEDMKHLLPLGDDIWNADTIRSMADGKLPPWSDFVFYKASRLLLLPDIIEEVQYNLKYEIVEEYPKHSLSHLVDPSRDICEEAKTNFREASKLGVIVTGLQHSGTTMLSQLIKSAPGLFGGFECDLLSQEAEALSVAYEWLEWSVENELWSLNNKSRDLVKNAKCVAEKYHYLHQYSPLFHFGNHQDDFIVDKSPSYIHFLDKIMDITPGIPVVVSTKEKSHLIKSWRKRGIPDFKIEQSINSAERAIEAAMKKYPDRLKLVNTTGWAEKPDEILGDVYDFLGKEWKSEYLNMNALNIKRTLGSVMSIPFLKEDVR